MKIETSTVKKLVISDVPRLDPITVFLEDFEPRKGKATITCYNESWTSYWGGKGAMGFAVLTSIASVPRTHAEQRD